MKNNEINVFSVLLEEGGIERGIIRENIYILQSCFYSHNREKFVANFIIYLSILWNPYELKIEFYNL